MKSLKFILVVVANSRAVVSFQLSLMVGTECQLVMDKLVVVVDILMMAHLELLHLDKVLELMDIGRLVKVRLDIHQCYLFLLQLGSFRLELMNQFLTCLFNEN